MLDDHAAEPVLHGGEPTALVDGRATFTLRMGKHVLTNKMGRQRFRVLIRPEDPSLRTEHPRLTVRSEPLKCVTKLERRRPGAPTAPSSASMPTGAPPSSMPPPPPPSSQQPPTRQLQSALAADQAATAELLEVLRQQNEQARPPCPPRVSRAHPPLPLPLGRST